MWHFTFMRLSIHLSTPQLKREFAELIKRDISTINRWCAGDRHPRPEDIEKIFKLTKGKVTPADFYDLDSIGSCNAVE